LRLTWAQKIALKKLCSSTPPLSELDLLNYLQNLGFHDSPNQIIKPLLQTTLVHVSHDADAITRIEPNAGKWKMLMRAINAAPLC